MLFLTLKTSFYAICLLHQAIKLFRLYSTLETLIKLNFSVLTSNAIATDVARYSSYLIIFLITDLVS